MFINRVELYHYKRLKNKGITKIALTFKEILQVIVGKNGGGKSSLMQELSPLPPDNGDYDKGGYKAMTCTHKGLTYDLLSYTGSPSRHSFIRNGVELNESKTLNAQKILVKEHFGLTYEIHDLILGLVNGVAFTAMSPSKRKEWLMAIHPSDLTFVNRLHEMLKTKRRDAKGGVLTTNKHLTELYARKNKDLDPKTLQTELDVLQARRDRIARLVRETSDEADYRAKFTQLKQALVGISDTTLQTGFTLKGAYTSRDDITSRLQDTKVTLQQLAYAHQTHLKELEELNHTSVFTSGDAEKDREELKATITLAANELAACKQKYTQAFESVKDHPLWGFLSTLDDDTQRRFFQATNELTERLFALVSLNDRTVTRRKYEAVLKRQYELQVALQGEEQELAQAQHKFEHFTKLEHTVCPSCHFEWIPGVSENHLQTVEASKTRLEQSVSALREELTKYTTFLGTYESWYQGVDDFDRYFQAKPALSAVYAYLADHDVHYDNNRALAAVLPTFHYVYTLRANQEDGRLRLEQLENKQKLFTDDAIEWYKRRYQEHEGALNEIIEQQKKVKGELAQLEQDQETIIRLHTLKDQVVALRAEHHELVGKWGEQLVTRVANEDYQTLQREHKTLTALLYDVRSLNGTIASTEAHVTRLKATEAVLALLAKATSPNEGFPAEWIADFIKTFTANLNAQIAEIWTDVLLVKPCTLENGELSYKFPLVSGEQWCETSDVSESSTGEGQIVNFVFRFVIMRYLGLQDFPLYMDEAGANFDEAHRPALVSFVKKLIASGEHEQIFLISHYIAQHGMLGNAQVCALSTDGVALPEHYNEHVLIE